MYNHFVCQLAGARPINKMNKNKQYKKQLNSINKQHNFIKLRALYAGHYEAEMKRSMILENLQHIHESLCFESGIRPSNPYRGMRPIDFTNKKIQSCQDCDGEFFLKDGSAELICVNCGRIEIFDGTAFEMRKTYNGRRTTRKYTFKRKLHKLLNSCYCPTKLYPAQIDEVICIFEHIQARLPKQICYPFIIYKILEKIMTKGPQLMILKYIASKIPASTYLKHEQTWNDLIYANHVML